MTEKDIKCMEKQRRKVVKTMEEKNMYDVKKRPISGGMKYYWRSEKGYYYVATPAMRKRISKKEYEEA